MTPEKLPKEGAKVSLWATNLSQSINPGWVIILTPLIVAFFTFLRRRKKEPSTPTKIAFGLLISALSVLVMIAAVNIGGNGSNDGFKAIFYGGSITKLKNKTYVDTKKFVNSDGIFSVELHKKTNFNTNIIDIIESNTINLKMIGVYKITYNVSWYLNDTIDCDKYLQANRDGILGFCQENTYNLIETSINRCKGNSFYVNLTHTFLYEKLTDNKSQINLYIYKLFKPYKDDLIINSSNTWLQIDFNPL